MLLKRCSVQSYLEIGLLPSEGSGSSISANHTFHRFAPRGSVAAMKKAGWGAALVAVILLAVAVIVEAQQPTKVPRIGFLTGSSVSALSARIEAFRQGLSELGYVEGKNIVIEWRDAKGNFDRIRELADGLVRLKLDLIVSPGPTVTRV